MTAEQTGSGRGESAATRGGGGRAVFRLAAALATFEVVASFDWIFLRGLPLAAVIGATAMPFAFWGLLAWPLRLLDRVRIARAPLGLLAGAAVALVYLLLYVRSNAILHRFGEEGPLFLTGLVVGGALFVLTSGGRARRLPLLLGLAWLPAAAGLGLWMQRAPESWSVPFVAAADAEPGAVAGGEQPDVVLISWDTVRADVLDAWGGSGTDTPNLDLLIADGVLFEDAVAVAPITGPSHASMLTGVYPPSHGLRSNVTLPMGAVPTLPALLAGSGYRTGGFVSTYVMLGKFGFASGFHRYDDRLLVSPQSRLGTLRFRNFAWLALLYGRIESREDAFTPGGEVNTRAAEWWARAGDEPQFLFLHYYDAHGPFEPPEDLRSKYLARSAELQPPVYDAKFAEEWALYRAEIELLDRLLGEVMEMLEARDPGLQNTLVLLTSDHGECFGEAGVELNHVASLHEATQHVPLVVRFPGARGAGTRVAETVTHLDLVPTLLAAGGVEESLWPDAEYAYPLQLALAGGMGYEERTVYLEAQQDTLMRERKRMRGWRTGEWKLLEVEDGSVRLFRYREDEDRDLAAERTGLRDDLLGVLRDFFDALPKVETQRGTVSAADEAAMAALGYAGD